ncbi:MAG TPA: hydroxyacylglutathione hydrolase [Steroidobacteraceae bacterium]|jgi:hydroxyacylglutathione hydrolase
MLIERVWADNEGRNFHYLVACSETREALAIDPLNWQACLNRARELGWSIRQIFNTHEHGDHTGGNAPLARQTGAAVMAHADAAARIGGITAPMRGGDIVRVGRTVQLHCLDTPGHTRAHLCLYADGAGQAPGGQQPALFSGDTLFNAGVGNCIHGGDPELLYQSFTDCLARLPGETRVFPGHEYLLRNLGFTLDREPGNRAARELAQRVTGVAPTSMPVLSLTEEKQVNVFFRLDEPEIIAGVKRARPAMLTETTPRAVFLALRDLRNRW